MHIRKEIRIRVAGILLKDDKLLMVSHKKNGDIYWLLPGGGVDYGESLTESLRREFKEELNIDVKIGDILLIADSIEPKGDRHIVNICFQCRYISGEYRIGEDNRLNGYEFFSPGDISLLKIYPPFNEDLVSCLEHKSDSVYIGSLWK